MCSLISMGQKRVLLMTTQNNVRTSAMALVFAKIFGGPAQPLLVVITIDAYLTPGSAQTTHDDTLDLDVQQVAWPLADAPAEEISYLPCHATLNSNLNQPIPPGEAKDPVETAQSLWEIAPCTPPMDPSHPQLSCHSSQHKIFRCVHQLVG
jgi:hypothetical protein